MDGGQAYGVRSKDLGYQAGEVPTVADYMEAYVQRQAFRARQLLHELLITLIKNSLYTRVATRIRFNCTLWYLNKSTVLVWVDDQISNRSL